MTVNHANFSAGAWDSYKTTYSITGIQWWNSKATLSDSLYLKHTSLLKYQQHAMLY
jgi:hypothetical protein